MTTRTPVSLITGLCLMEILGMATFATFPVLIPTLQSEWDINNTEAGWISGVYFAGYVVAVALLTALTDRMDTRRIYLACMTISVVSAVGFALFATDIWTASCWRTLQGIGLAGTYMPGLRALTDRLPQHLQSRATALYTSSFGIGASLSYYLSGLLATHLSWELACGLLAIGPLVALGMAMFMLDARRPEPDHKPTTRLLDFRPVIANRPALGFTIAYMVHNAELFAFRSWIVAFLIFSQMQQPTGAIGTSWNAATIVALLGLVGLPASVLGNELAARIGRQKTTIAIMLLSVLLGSAFGFTAQLPLEFVILLAFLYHIVISGESATVTAGVMQVAQPRYKGTTMAFHSVVGFTGGLIGPLLFGLILDLGGGATQTQAWGIAFATVALLMLAGPAAIIRLVGLKKNLL